MNVKIKKGMINAIIFLFFVILTFSILLKDNNLAEMLEMMKQVDKKFILISILCMCCFVLSEGINIARTLKLLDCKIGFRSGIRYALVGFFFSSVTPGASGGDPMQLYYMKKDCLPLGHSALAILTEFSSFQFVTVMMGIIGFVMNHQFIEDSVGNIKYLLFLGVFINAVILLVVLLMIFSKKLIRKLLIVVCQILKKLHYKKIKRFQRKCLEQIKEYKTGANLLIKHPKVLCKIIGTTILQVILYHSIPYFIYLALRLEGASFFQFVTLQAVLYIAVSGIPLPGAVGVSEGGFLGIYKLLFPAELLSSSMLLSRGISFYLFVLISGISILGFMLKQNKREKCLVKDVGNYWKY